MSMIKIIYNKLIYRPYIKKRLQSASQKFRLGFDSKIHHPEFISIRENFYSGPRTYIGTNQFNPIIINEDVMFGAECMIIGGNHNIRYTKNHMIYNQEADTNGQIIDIGKGVWIGTRSMIISGAVIDEGSVIGAMSLVNTYIPPYCLAVGIPAKAIKPRFKNYKELEILLNNVKSTLTIDKINKIYKKYSLPIYQKKEIA